VTRRNALRSDRSARSLRAKRTSPVHVPRGAGAPTQARGPCRTPTPPAQSSRW
jgi:hypothetical protein